MFFFLASILFFPLVLPFLILRFVFRLIFGLLMIPFVVMMILFGVAMAIFGVFFALVMPLLPFLLIALAVWALTRHSRAATAYLNS